MANERCKRIGEIIIKKRGNNVCYTVRGIELGERSISLGGSITRGRRKTTDYK